MANILQQRCLNVLTWHELLAGSQRKAFETHVDTPKTLVLLFDFAASLRLLSLRSDSREWRSPKCVGLFGVWVLNGEKESFYVMLGNPKKHAARHTAAHVINVLNRAVAELGDISAIEDIKFWSDGARTIKCSEFLATLGKEAASLGVGICMNYFVEGHGKSRCDGSFSSLKQGVRAACVDWSQENVGAKLESLLQKTHPKVKVVVTEADYTERTTRWNAKINNISSFYAFWLSGQWLCAMGTTSLHHNRGQWVSLESAEAIVFEEESDDDGDYVCVSEPTPDLTAKELAALERKQQRNESTT